MGLIDLILWFGYVGKFDSIVLLYIKFLCDMFVQEKHDLS